MDIKIISDLLGALSAGLGMAEKYGWRKGGLIIAAAVLLLAILLKFLAKKDKKQEEEKPVQSVGDGVQSKGKVVIKGITQKSSGQQIGSQSVGKDMKAGKEGLTIEDIHQE